MINIGSNRFDKVAIPLIFKDRYFLLEDVDGNDVWTVLTFSKEEPIIEVLRNTPQQNSITTVETNPTGIVTVSHPSTGAFLYKLRPGSKNSSIFGSISDEEAEIKITDREIRVGTNVFQNNKVSGFPVGIHISNDGGIAIGAQLPPQFKKLIG